MPTIVRPTTIQVHMPAPPKPCKKPCPCFEQIELSDEESEPDVVTPPPITGEEPPPAGASEEDLNAVKEDLLDL